eukprot:scaffold1211_cov195-Alexandrium_tamarense.AAC.24
MAYLRTETTKSATVSSTNSNKKRRRTSKLEAKAEGASIETDPVSKKTKSDDDAIRSEEPVLTIVDSKVTITSNGLTAESSAANAPPIAPQIEQSRQSSDRRRSSKVGFNGMNPRKIHTGIYGLRGESIRRTVYDGALGVDDEAYKIVRDACADYLLGNVAVDAASGTALPLLSGRPEWKKHLPLTAFTRPSVDASLGSVIIVTELSASDAGTVATNRKVDVLVLPKALKVDAPSEDVGLTAMDEPLRIRGGGTEDEPMADSDKMNVDTLCAAESSTEQSATVVGEAKVKEEPSAPAAASTVEQIAANISEEAKPTADGDSAPKDELSEEKDEQKVAAEAPSGDAPTSSDVKLSTPQAAAGVKPPAPTPVANPSVLCKVDPLPANHQLSSSIYHPPTPAAVFSTQENAANSSAHLPSWYDKSTVSDIERRSLPEWFNGSAPHRSEATYIDIREKILDLARKNENQYITATALGRSITGDAGSLLRLHKFLSDMGFVNAGNVGESAPSEVELRGVRSSWVAAGAGTKRQFAAVERSAFWSSARLKSLETIALNHVSSSKSSENETILKVNWDAVASEIGEGVTAIDCQRAFIRPPKEDGSTMTDGPDESSVCKNESMFSHIIDTVRPEVLKAAIDASLKATQDMSEARKASLVGVVAGAAAEKAREGDNEIRNTLMDIIDQRVQRLENRIALLDDAEALLEAERVALELERRDMYTARCRHWFGDGSA